MDKLTNQEFKALESELKIANKHIVLAFRMIAELKQKYEGKRKEQNDRS